MEQSLRYGNDQYGNDDYAQLDRWSGHAAYKSVTPDSSSLIYTSDYGSYSSQESNHSGTNYSNLADCEEALHSPPTAAYDLSLPQFSSNMEKRREKPLPPPRMTSRVQTVNNTRFLEPVKEKKISFDDSALVKCLDGKLNKSEEHVPSFATLPRKKKLSSNASTGTAQSAPQVTWMKEVAQKGEEINRTKSANVFTNKKPQGILKNKIVEDKAKKGDTTGYIKRNTVQKILEKQKLAKNRQSAAAAPQLYKSTPTLSPMRTSTPEVSQHHKAWEYNFNNNSAGTTTAQVIGVFEPSQDGAAHMKQNSAETEFEFPPPPSDQDINQLMTPGSYTVSHPHISDFSTPLNLACARGESAPPSKSMNSSTDKGLKPRESTGKPPVPLRPKKPILNNSEPSVNQQHGVQTNTTVPSPLGMEQTTPIREQRPPYKQTQMYSGHGTSLGFNVMPLQHIDTQVSQNTDDIVLPPPPEFQEGNSCTALATDQPSYGDYELLSEDSKYDCSIHPTVLPYVPPKVHGTNHTNYHHRIPVDQLETQIHNNLKVSSASAKATKSRSGGRASDYSTHLNGYSHSNNTYNNKHISYVSHKHQYSTEL